MIFRNTTPAEQQTVRRLLRDVFAGNDNALFLNDEHLRWKYYTQRRDWPGSRSFGLFEGERLMAHACAWPVNVSWNETIIRGFHPIDWAASAEVPGAGALLLREMRKLTDVSLCIGGTDVARKVIANCGYRPAGEMKYYARPLRPWLQARTHRRRNWKLPARLLRNWLWNVGSPVAAPAGWTAERIKSEQLPPEVTPASRDRVTACARSAEQFSYLEQCPIAQHELYLARDGGRAKGYFFLSLVPGQARVADAWVSGGEVREWEALYRLALKTALNAEDAAEITTASAIEAGQQALTRSGFRVYQTFPVMLLDSKRLLTDAPRLHVQMIDNDFSFLHEAKPEYAI